MEGNKDGTEYMVLELTPVNTLNVLVGLRCLAKGAFFSEVADTHGVSRSSVCRIIHGFVDAVINNVDNIKFPVQRDDQMSVKRGFYRKCKFPNIVGAVDGTLVPILAPTANEESFVCRKGFHAINCQAVASSDLRFIDIVAKWPGSSHDAGVFDNSVLKMPTQIGGCAAIFTRKELSGANHMSQDR
ncbi:HARB1-like protein [Mya arenaria]|uniref:HARB1-like protein n=1 Tax=Mya arenaria TaxID=6604 RepID=A0ABY7ERI5_MYAAR|nr:HARB1-like protein [Mya arenaria]